MQPLRERHIKTLDALSAFALLVSAEGRLIEADVPRPDLLHCTLDQLRAGRFRDTFPRALHGAVDGAMKSALESNRPVRFKYALKASDGTDRLYRATISREGDGLLIIVRGATKGRHTARRIVAAVTREQQRIGQDLHDVLGSHLTGVAMLVWSLARDVRAGRSLEPEALEDVARLINECIEQARDLARGMGPFRALDLVEALQTLAESFRTRFRTPVFFFREGALPPLTKEETAQLFRIAQESLHNAVKHAHASRVDVRLHAAGDKLELVVQDDGVGMPDVRDATSGLGLSIIRYRARVIRARCSFERPPGGGTLVRCMLLHHDRELASKSPDDDGS